MVENVFRVAKSTTSQNGWEIIDIISDIVLDLPDCVYNDLQGHYITNPNDILSKIDTIGIALAGVTNSYRIVDQYSLENRSVMKSFTIKNYGNAIDDNLDVLESIQDYEKYHTIEMGRDVKGNDNTIHAYINTPKDGRLRSIFDKSIRLEAKRNNIKYWVDDYKIDAGSNGGKFVRPIGQPIEIM